MKSSIFWLSLFLLLALVACQSDDEPIPQPQPRTQQAQAAQPTIVQRVVTVTPRPSPQATMGPTVSTELIPYVGNWTALARFELQNVGLIPGLEQMTYSASSAITISLDGSVTGSGQFSPNFQSSTCYSSTVDTTALTFTWSGQVTAEGGRIFLDLVLTPVNPTAPEHYNVGCATVQDTTQQTTTEYKQPLLFPLLTTTEQNRFRLDVTTYTANQRESIDLGTVAGGYSGTLNAEINFSR